MCPPRKLVVIYGSHDRVYIQIKSMEDCVFEMRVKIWYSRSVSFFLSNLAWETVLPLRCVRRIYVVMNL